MDRPIDAPDTLREQLAGLERSFPLRQVVLPSGAIVAVRECGRRSAADSIVLLHGISSGAASWLQTAVRAAPHCHVLAWDAPGYGESTPLDGAAPADTDYAQRLHELLQGLGMQNCVLVGHSLGALMAAAYARGPVVGQVRRLVLISPAGGYGGADQAEAAQRVRRERRQALQSGGIDGLAQRIDQRLLSPGANDAARSWVRWNTARLNPHGYLQAVEMLCNSSLAAGAGSAPVEVHCGDADAVTPATDCRERARRLDAPFRLIEGAGHASPVEQPEAVAQLLRAATFNESSFHV